MEIGYFLSALWYECELESLQSGLPFFSMYARNSREFGWPIFLTVYSEAMVAGFEDVVFVEEVFELDELRCRRICCALD